MVLIIFGGNMPGPVFINFFNPNLSKNDSQYFIKNNLDIKIKKFFNLD